MALQTVDITTILTSVQAAIAQQFPAIPVLVKAAPAIAGGKAPQSGWTPGSALPCFVVSEAEAEQCDTAATFETVTLHYPVQVEYLKSAAPKSWPDDPDIRSMRVALEYLLYQPGVTGMPNNVCDIRFSTKPPYSPNESGNVVASGIVVNYLIWLRRPGTF